MDPPGQFQGYYEPSPSEEGGWRDVDDMDDPLPKHLQQPRYHSPLFNLPASELRDLERVWMEDGPEGPSDWQHDDDDVGQLYAQEDVGPYHGVTPPARAHGQPGMKFGYRYRFSGRRITAAVATMIVDRLKTGKCDQTQDFNRVTEGPVQGQREEEVTVTRSWIGYRVTKRAGTEGNIWKLKSSCCHFAGVQRGVRLRRRERRLDRLVRVLRTSRPPWR